MTDLIKENILHEDGTIDQERLEHVLGFLKHILEYGPDRAMLVDTGYNGYKDAAKMWKSRHHVMLENLIYRLEGLSE